MARVSSRYNYRISKNGNNSTKKTERKLLPPEQVVIRNKKKNSEKKVAVKKNEEERKIPLARRRIIANNKSISKKDKGELTGKVSLGDLQSYCKGKSIILVGNSKEIIKKELGAKIDSYDIVVRMNHGHPIHKYAKNMGRKYNIWAHGFLSFKKQIKEYNGIKKKVDFHIETNEDKLCRRIFDNKAFMIPKKWYKTDYEKSHSGKAIYSIM